MTVIAHSWPHLDDTDRAAVLACLDAGYVGHDAQCEAEIGTVLKQTYAYPVIKTTPSASIALLVILKHLGLSANDTVVMSSINCWSVYNLLQLEGCRPVVCDVRSTEDFRASFETIAAKVTDDTKAIIVTHMFGAMIETSVLQRLKKVYPHIVLIEDFSTSLFSVAQSDVGRYSDFGITSFGSTKPLTGGVGGALFSHSDILDVHYDQPASGGVSINTKLSAMNQALILNQLRKRTQINAMRVQLAAFYAEYVPVYGVDAHVMFRAVTFTAPDALVARLAQHDITLDIRRSVQPNLSIALGLTDNSHAQHFLPYYSLPLNMQALACLQDKGIITSSITGTD
jgi:dTDP-4-amino-4,6-dideoxygalactose transaminase